jgi:class 3 adenylate cyclase
VPAGPGEVFVSATTKYVLGGCNLDFESAGIYELKGLEGKHELFRLTGSS